MSMRIGIEGHNLEQSRWGVGHYISSLLEEFSRNPELFPDTTFFVYFHKKIPDFDFLKHERIIPRLIRPPVLKKLTSMNLFYHFLLPYAARRDTLDIMYFPSYLLPALYFIPGSATRFPYKKLIALHDIAYRARPEWFTKLRLLNYRISLVNAVRKADAILTISEFSKKEIMKYYPRYPAERIFVNYLAPKAVSGKPADAKEFLKQTGITDSFILAVGQITARRRVRESIEAFRIVGRKYPELQFLIIGHDRTYPFFDVDERITNVNRALGRNAVVRIDYCDDDALLDALYVRAELFLYISSYEGFGLPPMEAMRAGTPVILKKSELSKEVFDNTAFLVENELKPEEIAHTVVSALRNPAKRELFIQHGREIAGRYTWERHAQKLNRLFRTML